MIATGKIEQLGSEGGEEQKDGEAFSLSATSQSLEKAMKGRGWSCCRRPLKNSLVKSLLFVLYPGQVGRVRNA